MINKKCDVLVIGGGLSGLMASIVSARRGKKVLLVAQGQGAVSLSSGCIDLWGYNVDDPTVLCSDPLGEIHRLAAVKPEHPYAKAVDVLEESVGFFKHLCQDNRLTYIDNNGENWLLPTALGTVRPTYLAPVSMAVNGLDDAREIIIVGFRELKDFYPDVMASNLKASGFLHSRCGLKTAQVSTGEEDLFPNTLAHRLEQRQVLEKVIQQLKPQISQDAIVLLPPVLGSSGAGVAGDISTLLGCPVYEVANIPPALPGQRLQRMLMGEAKNSGVEIIMGCKVTGGEIIDRRCQGVMSGHEPRSMIISAGSYVLSTGSFLGGGLEASPGKVTENIFNLPVTVVQGKWSNKDFLDQQGQPFNRFGIAVNNLLQPVDVDGSVLAENILVTGANIAEANYPVEKCGNGLALVTGYKAGLLAGEV